MRISRSARILVLFLLVCGLAHAEAPPKPPGAVASAPADSPAGEPETFGDSLVFAPKPAFGDLPALVERGIVRILVPYSRTFFFIDQGRQRGTAAEFGEALQQWLRKRHKRSGRPVTVVFIPTRRDQLLTHLAKGLGDLAAGGLTDTPARRKTVDFVDQSLGKVNEVVVTGPGAPALASLDDLSGQEIFVRRSSSYFEHLRALNTRLKAAGKAPVTLAQAPEDLEDEDILEMVNAGLVPLAVTDDYLGTFWSQVYDRITVREDLAINTGGAIAWAVRKNCPKFKAEIDAFAKAHGLNTSFGSTVFARYLKSTKFVKSATDEADRRRFSQYIGVFERYGKQYDFDHLMLIAQGYQESGLDQSAKNPSGAVGVMQILPSTAENPPIGITGVDRESEKNIHAGVKYLRHLVEVYLNEPGITPQNKLLMAFAAYNAGPGNLKKFRSLAAKNGLDPDVWFYNVELGAAQIVGQETVRYVANIYKYYLAYTLLVAHEKRRDAARGTVMDGQ